MLDDRVYYCERPEFLNHLWSYRPGEHVSVIAPTDWGKTFLCHQLLARSATPRLPAVEIVMKPKDDTVASYVKESGFRKVTEWPTTHTIFQKPPGWVLWPKHVYKPEIDDPSHYRIYRAALLDSYKRGNRIVFADEMVGLCDLGLTNELKTIWRRGRSMKCGLWGATQRPREVPLDAYSQAGHLFLGNNPDDADRKRYSEIGGVDRKLVSEVVASLPKYHWLYIKRNGRNGPEMCIVGQ
jgi:hypothetical protein